VLRASSLSLTSGQRYVGKTVNREIQSVDVSAEDAAPLPQDFRFAFPAARYMPKTLNRIFILISMLYEYRDLD
jgi:hypothetical protein